MLASGRPGAVASAGAFERVSVRRRTFTRAAGAASGRSHERADRVNLRPGRALTGPLHETTSSRTVGSEPHDSNQSMPSLTRSNRSRYVPGVEGSGTSIATSARPPGGNRVRQPGARVIAIEEAALGIAQLRAEAHQPTAVWRRAGNGRCDRLRTRVSSERVEPALRDQRRTRRAVAQLDPRPRRRAGDGVARDCCRPRSRGGSRRDRACPARTAARTPTRGDR